MGKSKIPAWAAEYLKINEKDPFPHIKANSLRQLVVYRKETSTDESYYEWLRKIGSPQDVQIVSFCGTCDDRLMLLTGDAILDAVTQTFINPETTGGGNTPPPIKRTGEDDEAFYFYNIKSKKPEDEREESKLPRNLPTDPNKYEFADHIINVGVFDTGVDKEPLAGYLYEPVDLSSCIKGASEGWNFADENNSFDDNYPPKHGTIVAALIIEQAIKYQQNPVRILPVKIHNEKGESDLYSVLCGFAYAKERGVKIINGSFGFYSPRYNKNWPVNEQSRVSLLRKYIDRYLCKNGIILVASAGNRTTDFFEERYRDLETIDFYPASLARNYKNIFAVTTVDGDKVAPTQNHSPNVVDVGVYADKPETFQFENPINSGGSLVKGSSFATPIFTGKLAANYDRIKLLLGNAVPFNKTKILDAMESYLGLADSSGFLADEIKEGMLIRKFE